MFVLRCGLVPKSVLPLAACLCLFAPAIGLSGCAADKPPSYVQGPSAQQLAARKVEMEDDGQPVQAPPARAVRPEEDDPSQPWSPRYGAGSTSLPSSAQQPPKSPSPYVPAQVDAAAPVLPRPAVLRSGESVGTFMPTHTGTLTRLSDDDADTIMTQAINAHEMRRQ